MTNNQLYFITGLLTIILFFINIIYFILWIIEKTLTNDKNKNILIYCFIAESFISVIITLIGFQGIIMRKVNFILLYAIL